VYKRQAFLTGLDGGCQVPIAAWSQLEGESLTLTGFVAGVNGENPIRLTATGTADKAWDLGAQLADQVLAAGGKAILDEVYARS